ncbi:hypothetical protein GCM10022226_52310 [Sphaerisporangium flaviroseum]|uniref:AB hydrolase-1 domain-containing protein n=1 Tax=Sphaerisporangium flaviroseum TaxID=509199 RepID=A0ABP7IRJ5_9ACTN
MSDRGGENETFTWRQGDHVHGGVRGGRHAGGGVVDGRRPRGHDGTSEAAAWKTIPSWYCISTTDRIIAPSSELSMARRARSKITRFEGGSHLTLISHPDAVTSVIASAICSVRQLARCLDVS